MINALGLHFRWLVLALCIVSFVACGEDTPTPSPTPTVEPITETFSGTIGKNGGATHFFTVSASGSVTSTLTALTPATDSNPDDAEPFKVGFMVGTWDGTVCTVAAARDKAPATTVIFGTVNAPGQLCVRVYDTGEIVDTADYTITVVHP